MTTDELIKQNKNLIYLVLHKLKPNDYNIEEDLFHEGLIALWKAIEYYDQEKYGTQLSTVAVRKIIWAMTNYLNRKHKHYSLNEYSELSYNPVENFWEYLPDTLTKKESQIAELKRQGYSIGEIGKKLRMTQNRARSLYRRTIMKIRQANNES